MHFGIDTEQSSDQCEHLFRHKRSLGPYRKSASNDSWDISDTEKELTCCISHGEEQTSIKYSKQQYQSWIFISSSFLYDMSKKSGKDKFGFVHIPLTDVFFCPLYSHIHKL